MTELRSSVIQKTTAGPPAHRKSGKGITRPPGSKSTTGRTLLTPPILKILPQTLPEKGKPGVEAGEAGCKQILVCVLRQKFQHLLRLSSERREPGHRFHQEWVPQRCLRKKPCLLAVRRGLDGREEQGGTANITDQDTAAQGNGDESRNETCLLRLMR